ncbi:MAG: C2H2-type zinc finger protein [Spirosomataceae bacterium]
MYETYLRQLFRLRTEYWQTQNTALRNLKLSRMVLFANACGVDLIEFLAEEAPDKSTIKAESEPKATEKAETKAKAPLLLQSPFVNTTINAKKASLYQCPNCDFITDSPKALSGHMKKHSSKYQLIKA